MKKTVIITGATSGIGKDLVKIFSKEYRVFAGYRNKDLIEPFDNVEYFYIDMLDKNSIFEAAEFIKSKVQRVDLLINVAGCVIAGAFEQLKPDDIRKQFEVNTFSHIEFSQKLLPVMSFGRIINISSMASFGLFPFISPYCASKRALDIFFNAFAIENHHNIDVVSMKLGVVATPLWQKSVELNEKTLSNCEGYETEMNFMKQNALKNSNRGLKSENVAKFIYKVAKMSNPSCTYTLGADARMAEILSHLPQNLLNKIVKFGLKFRSKRI